MSGNSILPIELIYCAAYNHRFAEIALNAGFSYGARLPGTVIHPITFADQNYKAPNRSRYMAHLAKHRPRYATVLDIDKRSQVPEVLDWAEEASQYVTDSIILIPKVSGIIQKLPEEIGACQVRLGFSVPTSYGGTTIPLRHFGNRPIHLLGGRPEVQMGLIPHLNVKSVDCNYHMLIAQKYGDVWTPFGKVIRLPKGVHNNIYRAFELSCKNIVEAWKALYLL